MATQTLIQMRALVRELADQETLAPTTALVEDDELDKRVNEALCALRDLLIELEWMEWVTISTQSLTLINGTQSYALAADFYLLLGVRGVSGGIERQLEPWHYQERAPLEYSGNAASVWELQYRLNGANVVFLPTPRSADTVKLDYVPAYTPLVNGTDNTFAMPYGWWLWAGLRAALALVAKEALDGSTGTSLLLEQWRAEDARIRGLAAQRDAGKPPRIIDTRKDGGCGIGGMGAARGLPHLWES